MVENLGPKRFEHARRQFWERVERRAGSRREIVKAADGDGYRVSEQSVGGWVRGENEPSFAVFLWASHRWDISIDELRLGRPFQAEVSEQLAQLAQRQERIEGRLALRLSVSRDDLSSEELASKVQALEQTQDWLLAWLMRDPEFVDALRTRAQQRQAETGA